MALDHNTELAYARQKASTICSKVEALASRQVDVIIRGLIDWSERMVIGALATYPDVVQRLGPTGVRELKQQFNQIVESFREHSDGLLQDRSIFPHRLIATTAEKANANELARKSVETADSSLHYVVQGLAQGIVALIEAHKLCPPPVWRQESNAGDWGGAMVAEPDGRVPWRSEPIIAGDILGAELGKLRSEYKKAIEDYIEAQRRLAEAQSRADEVTKDAAFDAAKRLWDQA